MESVGKGKCCGIILVENFVSSNLVGSVVYALNACDVWNDLKDRFHKIDGARTFNLHQEIISLTQGIQSVYVHFS